MARRNEESHEEPREEPQRENHEERQGGGGGGINQEGIIFGNRRIIRDSPLDLQGDQHDLPILPERNLKEFFRDWTIDAKRHLNYS